MTIPYNNNSNNNNSNQNDQLNNSSNNYNQNNLIINTSHNSSSSSSSSSSNNNNNSSNQNDQYNNKLYNSVFNNIVIRRIIFNHLNKFNILYNNIIFHTIEEWDQFKYKDYLNKVTIRFDIGLIQQQQLDNNIKHITILAPSLSALSIINSNDIVRKLERIDSIKFNKIIKMMELESTFIKSIISTSKLNTLQLSIEDLNQLQPNTIPQSITDLDLSICSSGRLLNNILPSGLKRLKINNIESFQDGCLPESLTNVSLTDSIGELINQLSSNGALVNLYLFNIKITSNIIFPNSIQDLSVYTGSFNSEFPNSLKSLYFTIESSQQQEIIFPSTLEHLIYINTVGVKSLYLNYLSFPVGLKSLYMNYPSITNDQGVSILPSQLESLTIDFPFYQALKVNQLPSSLTYLSLDSDFDQVIDIGVLPSTLKTLELGYEYSQEINPLAIPHQLKSLIIINQCYYHPIKLTPSTHPNTLIQCHNINLYYQPSNTDIRVLALPDNFNSPLSTLQLQDKSKLEYLKLGRAFNIPIQLIDFPINNQIKTLELNISFEQTINLEHFQNLETIIIKRSQPKIITTSTTTTSSNNNNTSIITYNNYKLQNIILENSSSSYNTSSFIKQLNPNFYQFIKLKKETKQ